MNTIIRRPAKAYAIVLAYLPGDFLDVGQVVYGGICMQVTGRDGMTTQWEVTEATAYAVIPKLRTHPDITKVVGFRR